jgi:Helix-turn-helix domain/Domain of unknown function (DUF4115)
VGAFGEKLRKQRELRGISLDAISTVTKISPRMLRAIEDEHFDQLPGGVFNKGFVRAYARQVGLDEEEAVTDYLAALRENQIHAQTILPNFRSPGGKSLEETTGADSHNPEPGEERRKEIRRAEDREDRDRTGKGISKEGLGRDQFGQSRSVQDFDGARQSQHTPGEFVGRNPGANGDAVSDSAPLAFLNLASVPAQDVVQNAEPLDVENPPRRIPWEKLAAVLVLITLALAFWALRRHGQPVAASQPAASQPTASQAAVSLQPSTSQAPVLSSTAGSYRSTSLPKPPAASHTQVVAPTDTASSPDSDVDLPVAKSQALPASKNLPATFTLVIRAAQTSWVSISADGQPVAQETLFAPANTSVRATREVIVKAGNAAGISFLFNGKEIPASGDTGEVRTYIFDSSGIRTSATLQAPDSGR